MTIVHRGMMLTLSCRKQCTARSMHASCKHLPPGTGCFRYWQRRKSGAGAHPGQYQHACRPECWCTDSAYGFNDKHMHKATGCRKLCMTLQRQYHRNEWRTFSQMSKIIWCHGDLRLPCRIVPIICIVLLRLRVLGQALHEHLHLGRLCRHSLLHYAHTIMMLTVGQFDCLCRAHCHKSGRSDASACWSGLHGLTAGLRRMVLAALALQQAQAPLQDCCLAHRCSLRSMRLPALHWLVCWSAAPAQRISSSLACLEHTGSSSRNSERIV